LFGHGRLQSLAPFSGGCVGRRTRRWRAESTHAMRVKARQTDDAESPVVGTVVIGTYDGGLVGLHASSGEQAFGYAPHAGCIKGVTCNDRGRCASGGTDHMVRLFDLARGIELGELQEHDDTVSCVEFSGAANLVTGGADGLACIWRCSDFELLLKFRAHKTPITCLAVHQSGKLMASAGRDSSIRLWDLMRGTSAANVPVDDVVESLSWSPSGNRLVALSAGAVTVVDVTMGGAAATWRSPSAGIMRIALSAAIFLRDGEVLMGDAKGELRVLEFQAKDGAPSLVETLVLPSDAKRVRVKGIVGSRHGAKGCLAFAVGTSSGRVEMWRFVPPKAGSASQECFQRLHEIETGVRLTTMSFWSGTAAQAAQEANPLEAAMAELDDESVAQDMDRADKAVTKSKKDLKRKRRA